jgi:DNA invertase Pin-like site-specific DNA recombinase
MITVAAYARFSSEMQRATSVEDQLRVARTYAREHEWIFLEDHIYTDEAVSGASLDRPGLHALRAAVARRPRPFDVLLVDDSSRISRDMADAVRLIQELKFAGVRVIYISQNIDSATEQAETLIAVHGVVDSLYLREMAKKIKRGLAGQHARGFATGGRTYGYRTVPVVDPSGKLDPNGHPALLGKRIEVDPLEAEVVRRIFEWFADGCGRSNLVERLNLDGYRPPRGSRWKAGAVGRILTNERYLGRHIWGQKSFERRPGTRHKVARPAPRSEWRMEERPELRIVSDDLWRRARERQANVREMFGLKDGQTLVRGRNGSAYSRHLFTGRLRCGICDGGVTTVTSGHGSPRYGCQRSWKNGRSACSNRLTVRARVADPALLAGLQTELLRPDTVQSIAEKVAAEVSRAVSGRPTKRAGLKQALADAQRKLAHLIVAVEDGATGPAIHKAIQDREREVAQLRDELASLNEPARRRSAVTPDWIRQQLENVVGLLQETPERTRAELNRLAVSFTLTPVHPPEGRSFLRAEGNTDLSQVLAGPTQGSTVDRSLPR